ncbi:bifunctional diaminohydroxyphosphoribosylaminopyrimidine deaminase/5-amino-6-(5-phosphoribosylamino)uracil reductase RibD [Burkholderiaceae bacterium DAT-1]|nr:bifunctional diaminohydroxyphosphoribosylaminopyrimidine deaminase/5-amino-6-(5-phosphoribosylamino)uracil reductase RibD [Burkholderiaceae bacterium DAT-1]
MARALQLAAAGRHVSIPNPNVGCVLVRDDVIIGEGYTQADGGDHAEVTALKDCRNRGLDPAGATAYVTLEPCAHYGRTPPCALGLINARVARVVAALQDPFPQVAGKGLAMLADAGIAVQSGLMQVEARQTLRGFLSRIERGRPWVMSKIAASLDGKTALASGESKWITGAAARQDVQTLRAHAAAILTGVGTILADDPALTVREYRGDAWTLSRQPVRVIVDSQLRTPASARVLREPGQILIVAAANHPERADALRAAGAEVLVLPDAHGRVDLPALLAELAARRLGDVMVEAGATLNGAMLAAGLVDELVLYQAPVLLGSAARSMAAFSLDTLADKRGARWVDTRMVGADVRHTLLFDATIRL